MQGVNREDAELGAGGGRVDDRIADCEVGDVDFTEQLAAGEGTFLAYGSFGVERLGSRGPSITLELRETAPGDGLGCEVIALEHLRLRAGVGGDREGTADLTVTATLANDHATFTGLRYV